MPRHSSGAPAIEKPEGHVTAYVLAMAIRRTVLDQYQRLCEKVGFLPVSISCAALWMYDFYRPTMAQAAELLFVHQAADSMTCFAIRQGVPVFCRSKARRAGQGDPRREIQSTVQFYDDLYPHGEAVPNAGPIPLYLVGDGQSRIEEPWSPGGQASWLVQPIQPDWKILVEAPSEILQTPEALCALACAVGR